MKFSFEKNILDTRAIVSSWLN